MEDEIAAVRRLLMLMKKRQGKAFVSRLMDLTIESTYTSLLKPGDSAIDVGANRGRHTLPMARSVGQGGRVYAIEAAAETLVRLHAGLQKARVPGLEKTVSVFPVAVSDVSGIAEFTYLPGANARSGLGSSDLRHEHQDARTEKVRVERLDDLIPADDNNVRFIKMDIEGAELNALRGAVKILDRCRPVLVFENGRHRERFNYTTLDVCDFFEQRNYLLYTPFGVGFGRDWMDGSQPGQLFAIPEEKKEPAANLLTLSTFRAMMLTMPPGEDAALAPRRTPARSDS